MQVGGRNYLIPVQVDIRGENEIQFKAIEAGGVEQDGARWKPDQHRDPRCCRFPN